MKRANILFCLADDAWRHFSAYGCQWVSTPAFDRVAREGLLFEQAYTPNAKCAPSRAAILTGRNPWQLEEAAHHCGIFPAKFQTVWEALAAAGYHTGHTQKGWAPGIPGTNADGSPRELTGTAWSDIKLAPQTTGICNTDYAANFSAFLDAQPNDKPFCFWFGCYEPHRDYEYGSGARLGKRKIEDIPEVPAIWPDNEVVRNDLLDYGLEIEHFDNHLGLMLAEIERRGQLDNTLVVVTSDNGMPFPRAKGQEYEMSNHLPLAMAWPAGIANPGRRVAAYTSFIDFAPTFLEVAGISQKDSAMSPITGKSLTDIFADKPTHKRDCVLIGKERHDIGRPAEASYPIRGIFEDGWLYLRNLFPDRWPAGNPELGYPESDGSPTKTEVLKTRYIPSQRHFWEVCFAKRSAEELYHVETDTCCLDNLVADPTYAERLARLRSRLDADMLEQCDPRALGNGDIFETYPWMTPWFDNFYDRWMRRHETGENIFINWTNPTDVQEP